MRACNPCNRFDALLMQFEREGQPLGVDVSACQGNAINWYFVRDENPWLSFAICKENDGAKGQDPTFVQNAIGIQNAGLSLGVYSVVHPDDPMREQALASIKRMVANKIQPRFFLIDFETKYTRGLDAIAADLHEYVQLITNAKGAYGLQDMPCLLYTYPGFIAEFGDRFADLDVALATYSGKRDPAWQGLSRRMQEATHLYQFSGWGDWADRGIAMPLCQGGAPIPIDHDVILSDDLAFYVRTP